jgi:hypothetical protein
MELPPSELSSPDAGPPPTVKNRGGDKDWAYISYPNGVPTVKEVKEIDSEDLMPKRTPVKVVTREVPGLQLKDLSDAAASEQQSQSRFKDNNDKVMQFRRNSEQQQQMPTLSKRCSGEFQFVRTSKSGLVNGAAEAVVTEEEEEEEVVKEAVQTKNEAVVRRTPTRGLGRRAATQIHIEQKKKNSYNFAMYKSQENLVKVRQKEYVWVRNAKQITA